MTDPWSVRNTNEYNNQTKANSDIRGFEDCFSQDKNFSSVVAGIDQNRAVIAESELQRLPDSKIYLQNLERKLEKLKKSSKLVEALSEKRDDCLRSMLQNNINTTCDNDLLLELETSIINSDSAVQNLYRQIQPVQPVTVGETVHIVKYDHLEQQRLEAEANEEREENLPASR